MEKQGAVRVLQQVRPILICNDETTTAPELFFKRVSVKAATFPAILDKVSTLKDNSLKCTFVTREMSAEDATILMSMRNREGWALFSENSIQQNEIPNTPAVFDENKKSDSQRLRAVLFVRWDKLGRPGDFDQYRHNRMEQFINEIKEEIDSI